MIRAARRGHARRAAEGRRSVRVRPRRRGSARAAAAGHSPSTSFPGVSSAIARAGAGRHSGDASRRRHRRSSSSRATRRTALPADPRQRCAPQSGHARGADGSVASHAIAWLLIERGWAPATPAAVICRRVDGDGETRGGHARRICARATAADHTDGPGTIVIGDVVRAAADAIGTATSRAAARTQCASDGETESWLRLTIPRRSGARGCRSPNEADIDEFVDDARAVRARRDRRPTSGARSAWCAAPTASGRPRTRRCCA